MNKDLEIDYEKIEEMISLHLTNEGIVNLISKAVAKSLLKSFNQFGVPVKNKTEENESVFEQNRIARRFIEDCYIEPGSFGNHKTSDVYGYYERYCKRYFFTPLGKKPFYEVVNGLDYVRKVRITGIEHFKITNPE